MKCHVSCQLVLQIHVKKVKLHPNSNPDICSELIELQENWGGEGNQTQVPNFQFYIGIAASSAMDRTSKGVYQ